MRIKTIFILCFALLLFSGCANNKKEKVETSPVLSEIQKKYIDEGWLLKSDSSMDGELPSSPMGLNRNMAFRTIILILIWVRAVILL